jgi:dynein heavy chain
VSKVLVYRIGFLYLTPFYNAANLLENLKYLYRTAGQQDNGLTFMFIDQEIEYMNNILSGEVSELFARNEMDEILQELIDPMKEYFPRKQPTNENLYKYYPTTAIRIVKTGSFIQNVGINKT